MIPQNLIPDRKNKNARSKWLVMFTILFSYINSQTINCTGSIIDKNTTKPIPFTSLGIIKTKLGTVTDERGNFSFSFDQKHINDTLRFNCIGYESLKMSVKTFMEYYSAKKQPLGLQVQAVQLNEVLVSAKKQIEKKVGYTGKASTVFAVFGTNDAGLELAQRMKAPKKTGMLKEITFGIAINPFDTCNLEIIIYDVDEDGFPGKPILSNPIYVKCSKKKGEYENISLIGKNISVTNDFYVSVKCLDKHDRKIMENPFTIMGVMGRHSYIRQSSEDAWYLERIIGLGINCKILY